MTSDFMFRFTVSMVLFDRFYKNNTLFASIKNVLENFIAYSSHISWFIYQSRSLAFNIVSKNNTRAVYGEMQACYPLISDSIR